jgi:hypothetical protein
MVASRSRQLLSAAHTGLALNPRLPLISAATAAAQLKTAPQKTVFIDATWFMTPKEEPLPNGLPYTPRNFWGTIGRLPCSVHFDIDLIADLRPVDKTTGEFVNVDLNADQTAEEKLKSGEYSVYGHMMPSKLTFERFMNEMGIENDDTIICYDTQGIWSAPRAWFTFRHFMLENSYVLDGGFPAWIEEGLPVIDDPELYPGDWIDPESASGDGSTGDVEMKESDTTNSTTVSSNSSSPDSSTVTSSPPKLGDPVDPRNSFKNKNRAAEDAVVKGMLEGSGGELQFSTFRENPTAFVAKGESDRVFSRKHVAENTGSGKLQVVRTLLETVLVHR